MQNIVRQMLIAVGVLVVIAILVQVVGNYVAEKQPQLTPTPWPTNPVNPSAPQPSGPSLAVHSQKFGGQNTILVAKVITIAPGWVTIRPDASNNPGAEVLGYAAVPKGFSNNVVVKLTKPKDATNNLWAVLHVDAGTPGVFEFPGPDEPVKAAGGAVVRVQFSTNP